MGKNVTKPQASWQDDRRKVFRLRVARMVIGDALICSQTKWRVDCLADSTEVVYQITKANGDTLKRKRLESVIDYLVDKAPLTLEYVQEGAIHLLDLDYVSRADEILGYYPALDLETIPEMNYSGERPLIEVFFNQAGRFFYKYIPPSHHVTRLIVYKDQINWGDESAV
jgi:hypothetical protein